jgi:hypothetical protein
VSLHKQAMTARKKEMKAEKRIALPQTPVRSGDQVRARLAQLGVDERDVIAAVLWARGRRSTVGAG